MSHPSKPCGCVEKPQISPEPPKAAPDSLPITKRITPLSESLRASLDALPDDALSVLGPDLFDQANKELNKRPQSQNINMKSGVLFNTVDGHMRFFYRDEKSRARHMYQNLVGLVYPCSKSDSEKRRLNQAFEEGWESGEHEFLARVPREDLELYQGA